MWLLYTFVTIGECLYEPYVRTSSNSRPEFHCVYTWEKSSLLLGQVHCHKQHYESSLCSSLYYLKISLIFSRLNFGTKTDKQLNIILELHAYTSFKQLSLYLIRGSFLLSPYYRKASLPRHVHMENFQHYNDTRSRLVIITRSLLVGLNLLSCKHKRFDIDFE